MTAQGVSPTYDTTVTPAKPFIWSTDLAGVPFLTHRKDWAAGGAALAYFVMAVAGHDAAHTSLIAHSHALQVVAFAAAQHGLKIDVLTTVGSPIRKDMAPEYAILRQQTRYWQHIHSDASDHWQLRGELFDGNWRRWFTLHRPVRECALADHNDSVPGVGHSDVLYCPEDFHYWIDRGWLNPFRPSLSLGASHG